MSTVNGTQPRGGQALSGVNPWVVLAFISIPVFVGSLDLTVVSAFLPELIIELELPLQTGLDDAAWILSAYLLAYTVSLAVMGRVSDLVGRRWVYVVALSVFIVGSVLVAVAHLWPTDLLYSLYRRAGERPDIAYVNLQAIIFGRVVQALGAGGLVPVSMALVADLFPPERRAQPLGFIGALDTLGWVLGHLYGGLFVQIMPWQGLFWMNVPLTLLAMGMTLYALRNVPQQRHKGRFDFLGAALLIGALTGLNIGLGANIDIGATSSFEDLGGLSPFAGPLLIAAGVFMLLFIVVELRSRAPLINLRMFRSRNLSAGAMTNLLVGYVLFIGLVTVPILVNVRAESLSSLREAALQVGLLLSTLTIPMAVAAIPGGWLAGRVGYRNTTMAGLIVSALGLLTIWQTWTLETSDALIAVQMAIIGVGIGLTFSPISATVINSARAADRGIASALVLVLRLVGMTVSVSSLTSYSLQRVNFLAAEQLGAVGLDPTQYADTYAVITVSVLAELSLIGAIVALAALIPAAFMSNAEPLPPDDDDPVQAEADNHAAIGMRNAYEEQ